MLLMLFLIMLIFLISYILMILNLMLSKKMGKDREKKSSYECGFDSYKSSRLPYSIHFFIISLIFLIFDVELAYLFPIVLFFKDVILEIFMFYLIFVMVFVMGLMIEWVESSLSWIF